MPLNTNVLVNPHQADVNSSQWELKGLKSDDKSAPRQCSCGVGGGSEVSYVCFFFNCCSLKNIRPTQQHAGFLNRSSRISLVAAVHFHKLLLPPTLNKTETQIQFWRTQYKEMKTVLVAVCSSSKGPVRQPFSWELRIQNTQVVSLQGVTTHWCPTSPILSLVWKGIPSTCTVPFTC